MGTLTLERLPVCENYFQGHYTITSTDNITWSGYIGVLYEWLSFQENSNPAVANLKLHFSFDPDYGIMYDIDRLNVYGEVIVFGKTEDFRLTNNHEVTIAVPLSGITSWTDSYHVKFKLGNAGTYDAYSFVIFAPCKLVISYPDTITTAESKSITINKYGATYSRLSVSVLVNGNVACPYTPFIPSQSVETLTFRTAISTYAPYFPTQLSGCSLDISATLAAYNNSLYHNLPELTDSGVCVMDMTPSSDDLKPHISALTVVEGATLPSGFSSVYVQNQSRFKVTPSVSFYLGATLNNSYVECDGKSYQYSGSQITTDIITASGSVSVVLTVTDSRGLTVQYTRTATVVAWFPPKYESYEVRRGFLNAQTFQFTPDDDGDCCEIKVKNVDFAPVNNLNVVSAKTTTPSGAQVAFTVSNYHIIMEGYYQSASTESSYELTLTLTDSFITVTRTLVLSTAGVVLDILSGGKGIGLGKVAETSECVEVNPQWDFKVYGMTLADYIRSIVGS